MEKLIFVARNAFLVSMVIHFAAQSYGIHEKIADYKKIFTSIAQAGHSVSLNWLHDFEATNTLPNLMTMVEGLKKADAVIIALDGLGSTDAGYQLAVALQCKKPTLLVAHGTPEESPFIGQVNDEYLERAFYHSGDELPGIIAAFIEKYNIPLKDLRFNFVIDRAIYNHLNDLSFRSGRTKADIVRELLQKDMQGGN